MATKYKLELQWTNKNKALYYDASSNKYEWVDKKDPRVSEPRILVEKNLYGDKNTENILIKGDNLLALKALMQDFRNRIDLIYIDPPYNTGNAFEHYDDGLEHSIWLSLIRDRVDLLHQLLSPEGFFCCQIDDSEAPYLKVLLDEIFGRQNYITTFFIQVRYGNKTLAEDNPYQKLIEQCFIYAKEKYKSKPNKSIEEYKLEKFEWKIIEKKQGKIMELGGKKVELFKPGEYDIARETPSIKGLKETWATGSLIKQKASSGEFLFKNLAPRKEIDGLGCLYKVYGIGEDGLGYRYFTGPKRAEATKGKFYSGVPIQRIEELQKGITTKEVPILNFYDLSANFGNSRTEGNADFRSGKKPEKLLEIFIKHFSNEGDIVLDSFGGSGTTGAVAHKMKRKWIMVELGEHAETHCLKRLKGVVDGNDQTGISKEVGWKGGGGFKYFELGDSLFVRDSDLRLTIINPMMYNGPLIRAVLKIEGFKLANPNNGLHDISGTTAAHVTEQYLSQEYIDALVNEISDQAKFIVIYAKTISSKLKLPDNVEVKRIPDVLLKRFTV